MIGRDNAIYQKEQDQFFAKILELIMKNPNTTLYLNPSIFTNWEYVRKLKIAETTPIMLSGAVVDFEELPEMLHKSGLIKNRKILNCGVIESINEINISKSELFDDMIIYIDATNLDDKCIEFLSKIKNLSKLVIIAHLSDVIQNPISLDIEKLKHCKIELSIVFNPSDKQYTLEQYCSSYLGCVKYCRTNKIELNNVPKEAQGLLGVSIDLFLEKRYIDIDEKKPYLLYSPYLPDSGFLEFGSCDGNFMDISAENVDAYNPEMALSIFGTNPSVTTPGCDTCKYSMSCSKQTYKYRYQVCKDIYIPDIVKCHVFKECFKNLEGSYEY